MATICKEKGQNRFLCNFGIERLEELFIVTYI